MKEYFFKPGDIVTVRADLCNIDTDPQASYHMDKNGQSDVAIEEMCAFRGKRVTISRISGGKYRIQECGCNWTDEMFEEYLNRNDVLHDDPDPEPVSFEDILSFYGLHG